jgi:hypothetical protein
MAAPTEAEIREAIAEGFDSLVVDHPDGIWDALAPINDSDQALVRAGWVEGFYPPEDHPGTLWADLRASESEELHAATGEVLAAALRDYLEAAREGAIAAAVRFAEAHPDIPRGAWRSAGDREPLSIA